MRPPESPGMTPEHDSWADFLGGDEAEAFYAAVAVDLDRRGVGYVLGDNEVLFDRGDGHETRADLQGLAQVCHAKRRTEWPPIIAQRFDTLLAAAEEQAFRGNFAAARDLLKVRVHNTAEYPAETLGSVVSRPVGPGLAALLVYDLPKMVQTVERVDAERWGVADDELFRIGLDAVRSETPPPKRSSRALPSGALVESLTGESFFIASRILLLDELLGESAAGPRDGSVEGNGAHGPNAPLATAAPAPVATSRLVLDGPLSQNAASVPNSPLALRSPLALNSSLALNSPSGLNDPLALSNPLALNSPLVLPGALAAPMPLTPATPDANGGSPAADRHGAIVSVPHRHALLFHVIRDGKVVDAVNWLVPLAAAMYREGPGSISPALYWWHAGALSLLPTRFDGRQIDVAPPPEFRQLLIGLR